MHSNDIINRVTTLLLLCISCSEVICVSNGKNTIALFGVSSPRGGYQYSGDYVVSSNNNNRNNSSDSIIATNDNDDIVQSSLSSSSTPKKTRDISRKLSFCKFNK